LGWSLTVVLPAVKPASPPGCVVNQAPSFRSQPSSGSGAVRAPLIQLLDDSNARTAYPISWSEQDLFFGKLTEHLRDMAEFDVNTGLRDQELCGLQWAWEHRVPELDAPGIKRSVFVLPAVKNKNRQARVVVLNDAAQAIIERKRGQHPVYVFTWTNDNGVRNRTGRMRNSGWVNARSRAAEQYPAVFGKEPPPGFRDLRAHDLRHTFGRRLRAAGVSKEDRKDLLGHKSRDVTTDYSAGELMNLIRAATISWFDRRTVPRSPCCVWWRERAGDNSRKTPAEQCCAFCGRVLSSDLFGAR
jgi:integrase